VEAVRYYRMAAEQGDDRAQYFLGACFAHGKGVPQDFVEAGRYYRLAAEQGLADAQFDLGYFYQHGEGVPQDWAEAVRAYRLAMAQEGGLSPETVASAIAACNKIACVREMASTCCMGCGAQRKLKTCAKCGVARFCGAERVARAWPAHRPNCKLWRGV
jgi:hypothetical protein